MSYIPGIDAPEMHELVLRLHAEVDIEPFLDLIRDIHAERCARGEIAPSDTFEEIVSSCWVADDPFPGEDGAMYREYHTADTWSYFRAEDYAFFQSMVRDLGGESRAYIRTVLPPMPPPPQKCWSQTPNNLIAIIEPVCPEEEAVQSCTLGVKEDPFEGKEDTLDFSDTPPPPSIVRPVLRDLDPEKHPMKALLDEVEIVAWDFYDPDDVYETGYRNTTHYRLKELLDRWSFEEEQIIFNTRDPESETAIAEESLRAKEYREMFEEILKEAEESRIAEIPF